MLPHSSTNLEIQRYYQNEPIFICDNLPDKIKDRICLINLDEYGDIGTHWFDLYSTELHSNANTITYFESFGVEHIPKEIKMFRNNKKIKWSTVATNIFRIQAYDSVMCGYFCAGVIDFMLKRES